MELIHQLYKATCYCCICYTVTCTNEWCCIILQDILICPASNLFTEDVSQLPSITEVSDDTLTGYSTQPRLPVTNIPSLEIQNSDLLECLPRLSHLTNKFYSACDIVRSKLNVCLDRTKAIDTLSG